MICAIIFLLVSVTVFTVNVLSLNISLANDKDRIGENGASILRDSVDEMEGKKADLGKGKGKWKRGEEEGKMDHQQLQQKVISTSTGKPFFGMLRIYGGRHKINEI